MEQKSSVENRMLFFDNLRYLMVLLVVILHAAISYSRIVPWWCVKDTDSTVFFDLLLLYLDVFLMPVLFFIAGYFAIPSFQKKNALLFLKRKFIRLGWPLLLGVPLISPVYSYIYHYTRNDFSLHMSFWDYWIKFMKDAGNFRIGILTSVDQFNQSHLWFISLLLFFFAVFAFYADRKKIYENPVSSETCSAKSILTVLFAAGLLSAVLSFTADIIFSTSSNPDPWIVIGNILQFQPAKVFMCILCFIMGVYAFYMKWFENKGIPGHPGIWTVSCVVLGLALLAILKPLITNFSNGILFLFIFVKCFLCISLLAAFISFGMKYWNRPSRFNELLASNSYSIYIVHIVIVFIFQLVLTGWSGPVFIKFGIVSLSSVLISYGISQYAIKQYPRMSVAGIYTLFLIIGTYLSV
ncbi:MAG: acyltransferase family protein [Desulfobacterales bacterium]|nr:acyltransferase family protein [Desulfobacterales bacterium]